MDLKYTSHGKNIIFNGKDEDENSKNIRSKIEYKK